MLFQEIEPTDAEMQHKQRCEQFASNTAECIRRSKHCLFSLLPHDELARIVRGWYEGFEQAMLRGNFGAIGNWIRAQSDKVAAEGFASEDLSQLLQICRKSAIEIENWEEDLFSDFDEVIREELSAARSWEYAPEPIALGRESNNVRPNIRGVKGAKRKNERRVFGRNRVQLPIHVTRTDDSRSREITTTQNISKSGLYFISKQKYQLDEILKVCYPFWTEPGYLNTEYSAKVIRLDELPDQQLGISLHFLESLGRKAK